MADSFSNRLTMRGPEERIDALVAALADPDAPSDRPVAFQQLLPEPELEGQDITSWREQNWGAPYTPDAGAYLHELLDERPTAGERVVYFVSDGGIPLPFTAALAAAWPEIEIEHVYHDPQTKIAGYAEFAHGTTTDAGRCADTGACRDMLAVRWPDELEFWEFTPEPLDDEDDL